MKAVDSLGRFAPFDKYCILASLIFIVLLIFKTCTVHVAILLLNATNVSLITRFLSLNFNFSVTIDITCKLSLGTSL